jgi:hypothetical protein
MITVKAYDRHVEQLFELMRRLHAALTKAEVEYRIVGGMAVFFQVSERDPDAARLTRDVDVAIDRNDLQRISRVAADFGFKYQHAAGIDMLVDAKKPKAGSAVHLLFVREKVRPRFIENHSLRSRLGNELTAANSFLWAAVAPGSESPGDDLYLMYDYLARTSSVFAPGDFVGDIHFPKP